MLLIKMIIFHSPFPCSARCWARRHRTLVLKGHSNPSCARGISASRVQTRIGSHVINARGARYNQSWLKPDHHCYQHWSVCVPRLERWSSIHCHSGEGVKRCYRFSHVSPRLASPSLNVELIYLSNFLYLHSSMLSYVSTVQTINVIDLWEDDDKSQRVIGTNCNWPQRNNRINKLNSFGSQHGHMRMLCWNECTYVCNSEKGRDYDIRIPDDRFSGSLKWKIRKCGGAENRRFWLMISISLMKFYHLPLP